MNSLEFIKQHVTEWPDGCKGTVRLYDGGRVRFTLFGFDNDTYSVDLSEHFAPDYYDGKVWTREEFEACGKPSVNWNEAPDWATSYGVGVGFGSCHVWYNNERYVYADEPALEYRFDDGGTLNIDEITHYADRPTPNTGPSTGIDATVEERGNRYGTFKDGADIMQELKSVMRSTPNWSNLTPSQREALEMIQHKVGRILNGDPNYTDSWHDIKGYAHLIEEELNGNAK